MLKRNFILITIIVFASVLFLNKPLTGKIPFPGDLLISEYNPWKTEEYLGYNAGSYPSKAQYFDVARQLYPWKTFVIQSLKDGSFPLWNPYNFSGHPLFANSQSQVLYPANIIFFVFDQKVAWTIFLYLQFAGSGLFTYLFARKIGLKKTASLFSSLAYTFSLFSTVFFQYSNIGHTILWLPALLYLIEKINQENSKKLFFLYSLIIPIVLFAGHLQLFFLTIVFSSLYGFFRLYSSKNKTLLAFFIITNVFGVLLSSVQLLPTLELASHAARSSHEKSFLTKNLLVSLNQFVLIFSPDFFGNPATRNFSLTTSYPTKAMYVGIAPLLFAAISVYKYKKNSLIKFFVISASLLIILISNNPIATFLYTSKVPFLSSSSPSNAIFLLSFILAILGGFGFQLWKKSNLKVDKKISVFPIIFIVLFLFNAYVLKVEYAEKNVLYTVGILVVLMSLLLVTLKYASTKKIISLAIITITVLDLFYFFQKFNPFVEKELVFPNHHVFSELKNSSTLSRFWSYGSADIEPNFATQYRLFDANGYDPLYPKWYGELISASKNGKITKDFDRSNRSDAVLEKGFGETNLSENKSRKKLTDLLGIQYVLDRVENASTEKTFPSSAYSVTYEEKNWKIFQNNNVLPRIFLAHQYQTYSSVEEFEKIFFQENFNPQQTILLEKDPVLLIESTPEEKPSVQVTKYSPNELIIQGKTAENALLFISDTFFPGWHATVNGKNQTILKAHYAFRAVPIPKGEFTAKFAYKPKSFSYGAILSIMSLFALAVTFLIYTKHEKKTIKKS